MRSFDWLYVRKAVTMPPVCPTEREEALRRYEYLTRLLPKLANLSEDCLYLNVYVPISSESFSHLSQARNEWNKVKFAQPFEVIPFE